MYSKRRYAEYGMYVSGGGIDRINEKVINQKNF